MSAQALIELRDVIRVRVELRSPKKGELMWNVPADSTIKEALDHVICGRAGWSAGKAGYGYRACVDHPEFENDGVMRVRYIVVHVDHVRTEPEASNIVPHVKLL